MRICQPSSGIRKIVSLERNFMSQGSRVSRNVSATDLWLDTNRHGRVASGCTRSIARKSQKGFRRTASFAELRWSRPARRLDGSARKVKRRNTPMIGVHAITMKTHKVQKIQESG